MLNWTPDFLKKGGERVERTKKMKEYRIRWGRRDEKKWGGGCHTGESTEKVEVERIYSPGQVSRRVLPSSE